MIGVKAEQDFGIAGTDDSRVAVGQVNAGVGQSDVIQHGCNFALRQILMQELFDLVTDASRLLDSKTSAAAEVQAG